MVEPLKLNRRMTVQPTVDVKFKLKLYKNFKLEKLLNKAARKRLKDPELHPLIA